MDVQFAESLEEIMSLMQDLETILDVVKRADPSFSAVDPEEIDAQIEETQRREKPCMASWSTT